MLKINGRQTRGLLDSGSCRTIIQQSFAQKLNLKLQPVRPSDSKFLFAAQGAKLHIIGFCCVEFDIAGLKFDYEVCCVSNIDHNLIIGVDLMEDCGITLDFYNSVATIKDSLLMTPIYNGNKRQFLVRTAKTTVIPPLSECLIDVKVSDRFRNHCCILRPIASCQFKQYAVAHSVNQSRGNHTVCSILNPQETPLALPKNKVVALASAIDVRREYQPLPADAAASDVTCTDVDCLSDTDLEAYVKEYGFTIGSHLQPSERTRIMKLLYTHRSVFARSISETKIYPHYQEHIQLLPEATPFYRRQFRLKPGEAAALHNEIVELEQAGMISNSNTPHYQTAVFGVLKKGTSTPRLVQDLRPLNQSVVVKRIPLESIQKTIEDIATKRARYFTVCDLKNAFWSVALSKESRGYTSFQDPLTFERKCWTVLPMGYVNSSAALNTVIKHVLSEQIGTLQLHTYADDLLVCSHTLEEHENSLAKLFTTLHAANLRLSPKKTSVAVDSVVYLSHKISADGILPTDDHIKIIREFPRPTSKKSLMRFLGSVTWLKNFLPQASQRTFHMRQLLRKDNEAHFVWSDSCEEEFQFIKSELSSPRILTPIDPNAEFAFVTDSSRFGLSWISTQVNPDQSLRLIGFGGKALTPAQSTTWTSTELELAAVCGAIAQYSCFLGGKTTHIISDNIAVSHLHKLNLSSARIKKMVVFLNSFPLTLRHIKGRTNQLADALSRSFSDMTEAQKIEFAVKETDLLDNFIFSLTDPQTASPHTVACTPSEQAPVLLSPLSCSAVQTRSQSRRLAEQQSTAADPPSHSAATSPSPTSPLSQDNVTPSSDLDTQSNSNSVPPADNHQMDFPSADIPIQPADYYRCEEFKHVYSFLRDNILSGFDDTDRITLLVASNYFYDADTQLLYKLALPCRKKQLRTTQLFQMLCVPTCYRFRLLSYYHDNLGHAATERLFLRLQESYFWKSMFEDAKKFSISCERCQQTKKNYQPGVPLHGHEIPSYPFEILQIDLKNLVRTTRQGNKFLMVTTCSFSKYCFCQAIKDSSSLTCAKALMEIIALVGCPRRIVTDRASYWTSEVLKHLTRLLQVDHKIASALNPASNGLAERQIQTICEQIRLYQDSDIEIEDSLPLILMSLRSAVHPTVQKSSHEIVFGSKLNVPTPIPVDIATPKFPNNQLAYFKWLREKLAFIHAGVAANISETRQSDKAAYDKRHHVSPPTFQIGDEVFLLDRRIKPRSDSVITHKPFQKRYVIIDKVASPNIGDTYRLADVINGKTLRSLISAHRMKPSLSGMRDDLQQNLSPNSATSPHPAAPSSGSAVVAPFQPAIRILRQQKDETGSILYEVLFQNGIRGWCRNVTPLLLTQFRLRQHQRRVLRKRKHPAA